MLQKRALEIMLSGSNVFLTGPPGSGKTYLLNEFISKARKKRLKVAVTATTGIAATHLNGVTIHSWAGIGIASELDNKNLLKLDRNTKLMNRFKYTDVLVIDEVSMLDAKRLDLINTIAKRLTGKSKPFGGLQIILVGDLFQLPPVGIEDQHYIFEAKSWRELDLKICYLSEQHRQQEGDELNSILKAIRGNRVGEIELAVLKSKLSSKNRFNSNILRMHSHNFDVDEINIANLAKLETKERTYKMKLKGNKKARQKLAESILSPDELKLKVGCEVIFTANNYRQGYVNGDRGRVMAFKSGYPIVRTYRKKYIHVKQHNWRVELDGITIAEAWQLPLKLAWAITIHKSQGMSLDEAEIDLNRAFSAGQGYVALSRLRNIDGLYLLGLNAMALYVDSKVLKFDRLLRAESDKLVLR